MTIELNTAALHAVYACAGAVAWLATMAMLRTHAEHAHKGASWHAWRRVCEQMLRRATSMPTLPQSPGGTGERSPGRS